MNTLPHDFPPLEYSLIGTAWEWGGPLMDEPEWADMAARIIADLGAATLSQLPAEPVGYRLTPMGLEIACDELRDRIKELRPPARSQFPIHLVPRAQVAHWTRIPTALTVETAHKRFAKEHTATPVAPPEPVEARKPRTAGKTGEPAANAARELERALSLILPYVSDDESRTALLCVAIDTKKELFVASNGHRLAYYRPRPGVFNQIRLAADPKGKPWLPDGIFLIHQDEARRMLKQLKTATDFSMIVRRTSTGEDMSHDAVLTTGSREQAYPVNHKDQYPHWHNIQPEKDQINYTAAFAAAEARILMADMDRFKKEFAAKAVGLYNERLKADIGPDDKYNRYDDLKIEKLFVSEGERRFGANRMDLDTNLKFDADRIQKGAGVLTFTRKIHLEKKSRRRDHWSLEKFLTPEEIETVWTGTIQLIDSSGADKWTDRPLGMDWRFFRDVVEAFHNDAVYMGIVDSINPVVFESASDKAKRFNAIIMPMRT